MSKALINENPLLVLPSLAVTLGLNEAIVLQQVHFWLQYSRNKRDGRLWVYKTYVDWGHEFPFWSDKTIRRAIGSLETGGTLLSTDAYNKMPMDKTKWYAIDYEKLNLVTKSIGQNDQMDGSERPDQTGQDDQSNNHRIPENTTENTKGYVPTDSDFEKWWSVYPEERKRDKAKAKEKWKAAAKEVGADELLRMTQLYAADKRAIGKDGKFAKMPTSFLNAKTYLDYKGVTRVETDQPDRSGSGLSQFVIE